MESKEPRDPSAVFSSKSLPKRLLDETFRSAGDTPSAINEPKDRNEKLATTQCAEAVEGRKEEKTIDQNKIFLEMQQGKKGREEHTQTDEDELRKLQNESSQWAKHVELQKRENERHRKKQEDAERAMFWKEKRKLKESEGKESDVEISTKRSRETPSTVSETLGENELKGDEREPIKRFKTFEAPLARSAHNQPGTESVFKKPRIKVRAIKKHK